MPGVCYVALGGALGASARYALSLLPVRGDFPVWTFLTNLLGAVAIGFLAGILAGEDPDVSKRHAWFWKTGFCGGFTTFSSFALETGDLIKGGNTLTALLYVILSVAAGVAAVFGGQAVVR